MKIPNALNAEWRSMTDKSRKLLKELLRLPTADQLTLAGELLAALEGDADEDVDTAWAAEIAERTRQIERGEIRPLTWRAVKRSAAGPRRRAGN